MAKVKFTNLKLNGDVPCEKVTIGEHEFEVLQYLSSEKKAQFVSRVVEQSIVGGIVRTDIMNPLFFFNLFLDYTNLTFTEKQAGDPLMVYDRLVNSEYFKLIGSIPEKEYTELKTLVEDYSNKITKLVEQGATGVIPANRKSEVEGDIMRELIESGSLDSMLKETFDL